MLRGNLELGRVRDILPIPRPEWFPVPFSRAPSKNFEDVLFEDVLSLNNCPFRALNLWDATTKPSAVWSPTLAQRSVQCIAVHKTFCMLERVSPSSFSVCLCTFLDNVIGHAFGLHSGAQPSATTQLNADLFDLLPKSRRVDASCYLLSEHVAAVEDADVFFKGAVDGLSRLGRVTSRDKSEYARLVAQQLKSGKCAF